MTHRELLLSALKKEKFKSILDVGCGYGQDLVLIKDEFPKVRIAGIDASRERIIEATEALGNIQLVVGYASELPFKDKSFDISFTDAVLMMGGTARSILILKEMVRVTKGKIFLIETHSKVTEDDAKFLEYNVRDYQIILPEMGLKNIKLTKITKDIWQGYPWENWGYLIEAEL